MICWKYQSYYMPGVCHGRQTIVLNCTSQCHKLGLARYPDLDGFHGQYFWVRNGSKLISIQYASGFSLPNSLTNNIDGLARSTDSYSTVTTVFSNIYQATANAVNISYKKSLWHITMKTMEVNLQGYTQTTSPHSQTVLNGLHVG